LSSGESALQFDVKYLLDNGLMSLYSRIGRE
jgi:hypothetical protein